MGRHPLQASVDEGRACTTDVPQVWGDSQAGIDLGIQVYVSVPVALSDGRIWGTLWPPTAGAPTASRRTFRRCACSRG